MRALPLAGRVAIVTGGGRGLGQAMANGLVEAGACVVITAAQNSAEIEQVASDMNRIVGHKRALACRADVRHEDDCQRTVDAAMDAFGGIHILINNAGRGMKTVSAGFLTQPTRFWEVEQEVWRAMMDTNVNGPFLMAKAVTPHMLHQQFGRIVNITMNHQTMRREGFSPYGPSKAALESATILWAQDLAGTGITVNGLFPGGASNTGMIPTGFPKTLRQRLLEPDIMIAPRIWLVSDEAGCISGRRINASRWDCTLPIEQAVPLAMENAGWTV